MKKIVNIETKWLRLFEENGLKDFDSFFQKNDALEELAAEKDGAVYRFTPKGSNKRFYLKVKFSEQKRKKIRSFLKGRIYCVPVLNEVQNIKYLRKLNFRTVETAAWGISKKMGHVTASFIMTEEVIGEEFIDLYSRSKSRMRRRLYYEYGKLLGLLHRNKIDSYVRIQDLICEVEESGHPKLTLIDREVGSLKNKNHSISSFRNNISHVFYEGLKRYEKVPLTSREGLSFCRGYLSVRTDMKLSLKALYSILMDEILRFIVKRKSFVRLAPLLPRKFLLWPYLKKKHQSGLPERC